MFDIVRSNIDCINMEEANLIPHHLVPQKESKTENSNVCIPLQRRCVSEKRAIIKNKVMLKRAGKAKEMEKQFQIKMKNAIINDMDFCSQEISSFQKFTNIPADLEEDILLHNARYLEKMKLGRQVDDILKRNQHVAREALPEHLLTVLNIYQSSISNKK